MHLGVVVSMPAYTLDGRSCAKSIEDQLLPRIMSLNERGVTPHLVVIIVGNDPASHVYVSAKQRACERLGVKSTRIDLPDDIDMATLVKRVSELNNDKSVNGILVQSPLPSHLNEIEITELISPSKDVDGFHPFNLGKLVQGLDSGMLPCTPSGVMELLNYNDVETKGKRVVVLGRSRIVGMPMSLMMAKRGVDSTVTITHSKTKDIENHCKNADIVIAAMGSPHLITSDWLKEGAVCVDVGISRVDDDSEKGYSLRGDFHPSVLDIASAISLVPGGVGPMTIAILMQNTISATEQQVG